jgi:hypothetical protein
MPLERDKANFGLEAFRQALARQEGSFMRAATLILNPKKRLTSHPISERGVKGDSERIATALTERNAKGQFARKSDG